MIFEAIKAKFLCFITYKFKINDLKTIVIHASKTASIQRRHPWIFSGAIKSLEPETHEGDLVNILDGKDNYLGFGYYQANNISVKILGFAPETYSDSYWNIKISQAYSLRSSLGLTQSSETNSYRLIHAEGDGIPGLIIDIYDNVGIIQCHSIAVFNNLEKICTALELIYGDKLKHIYNKSLETLPQKNMNLVQNSFLKGGLEKILIKENNIEFEINILDSQKTGFFLDQRQNRLLLQKYCANKSVLNTFCYTGGFSLYALKAMAKSVCSVDSSSKAMNQLEQNLQLNFNNTTNHESLNIEAINYLTNMEAYQFDVIILDPPAFAKNISKRHNAIQAYKRINISALKKINVGGILFTFSCSQVVSEEVFYHTIHSAGIEAKRDIRILHKLHQGPDHPISLFHPEGSYLKGLVLEVS
ncbi:MAG: class I SAM-dependent rRNA methyltransferase [Saprospiraceae bacterium]